MLSWIAPGFGSVPTSVLIAAGCGVPGLPGAPLAKGDGSPLCPSGALPNGVILDVDELAGSRTPSSPPTACIAPWG